MFILILILIILTFRIKPDFFNGSLSFSDEDDRTGWIRGSVVVNVTAIPANTTSFVVYFSNGGTGQDAKVCKKTEVLRQF
jgi:hypothetical protein